MNAPLRVPTRTRTPLMARSLPLKVPRLQIHRQTRLRQTRLMLLFPGLGAQPLLLLAELRLERGTEVVRLEHLANLHFALLEGRPLQPFDRLVQRFHLPQPETGDQLLRLGERPVDHRALAAREPDACAFGARLEPLAGEEHAGFLQFLIELAHPGQDLFVRKHARLRLLVRLHDDHDSHWRISSWFGVREPGLAPPLPTRRATGSAIDTAGPLGPAVETGRRRASSLPDDRPGRPA